jgi:hypothetical protein
VALVLSVSTGAQVTNALHLLVLTGKVEVLVRSWPACPVWINCAHALEQRPAINNATVIHGKISVALVLLCPRPGNVPALLARVLTGKVEALQDALGAQHACVDQSCACPGARPAIN